nr:MAG TPA: hypothetical protein [Caudoviricetes sp.]
MAKVSKPILLEETYREQSVIQNSYLKQIADTLTGQSTQESTASLPAAVEADTAKTASLVEYLCLLDGVPIESSATPKEAYTAGHWNKGMVKLLVERQRLTAAEYENITGEPYTA